MNPKRGFFFLAAGLVMITLCEAADNPSIQVVTSDAAVKGFPIVLKVTAIGRQIAPKMSLFDEHAAVGVRLKPKDEDGREYLIVSSKGEGMVYTNREGEQIDAGRLYRVPLGAGDKRSMLLDLASVRPEIGKGITMEDVPPGNYLLTIKFGDSGLESNSVPLVLKEPSQKEKAIAERIALDKDTGIRRTWCRLLRTAWPITNVPATAVSTEAASQLSFHQMLGKVLSSDKLEKVLVQDIRSASVPHWLTPERDALAIMVELATGSGASAGKAEGELLEQHPELRWRFDDFHKDGVGEFLRYALFLGK